MTVGSRQSGVGSRSQQPQSAVAVISRQSLPLWGPAFRPGQDKINETP